MRSSHWHSRLLRRFVRISPTARAGLSPPRARRLARRLRQRRHRHRRRQRPAHRNRLRHHRAGPAHRHQRLRPPADGHARLRRPHRHTHPYARRRPAALANLLRLDGLRGNSVDDYTIIDNPNTNGNPNAILIVTPRWPPTTSMTTMPSASGMPAATGRSSIKTRAAFRRAPPTNVKVYSVGSGVFRWSAASSTLNGNLTYITNSLIPAGASAKLLVTPVYDSNNVYDNYPIGTWWSGSSWTVFNQKASIAASAPMPANAAFNVVSVSGSGVFTQAASGSNMSGDYTIISATPRPTDAPTPCRMPPRCTRPLASTIITTSASDYTGGHWAIFNQDLTGMTEQRHLQLCRLRRLIGLDRAEQRTLRGGARPPLFRSLTRLSLEPMSIRLVIVEASGGHPPPPRRGSRCGRARLLSLRVIVGFVQSADLLLSVVAPRRRSAPRG